MTDKQKRMEYVLLAIGAGAAYWYFRQRDKTEVPPSSPSRESRSSLLPSVQPNVDLEADKKLDAFIEEELKKLSTKMSELTESSLLLEFENLPMNEGLLRFQTLISRKSKRCFPKG